MKLRKLIGLSLLATSLSTCALAKVTQTQIQHFSKVKQQAEQLLKKYKPQQILLVFDNDDTLLTLNQYLGSVPWWSWQSELSANDKNSAQLVSKNFNGLMDAQILLFSLSKMHATEKDIPSLVSSMQAQGIKAMVLSARGPNMRNLTEAAMKQNHLSFTSSAPGKAVAGWYCPGKPTQHSNCANNARLISFQHGIMLEAGQNKGTMLQDFLYKQTTAGKKIKAIIFVDDQASNTKAVAKAFKNSSIDVITDRYGFDDQWVKDFSKAEKAKVTQQWHALKTLQGKIFR